MKASETPSAPPLSLYILAFLVLFQALSGMFGGFSLILDPTGASLQMPAEEFLDKTPFTDYLIPGIILAFLLGVYPLIVLAGLMWRPSWRWPEALNLYPGRHWAWAFSLYLGFMLIIWINVQMAFIGGGHVLQIVYSMLGAIILIVALVPGLMRYFQRTPPPQ